MHVFTSIAINYLPKARVLARSLKQIHPDYQFHLILCDRLPDDIQIKDEPFDSIFLLEDFLIPNIRSWLFKHSVIEICTAVKGIAFQKIFQRFDCAKVIFLDPDIAIFKSLEHISDLLDTYSVVLTPHQSSPEIHPEAVLHNEVTFLKYGTFNFGFLGIRNSPEGWQFLNWWSDRCLEHCYVEPSLGLFTDQCWGNLIPAFFTNYYILRDVEYNVANWNMTLRHATGSVKTGILINDRPLCFYHFSGLESGTQDYMLERYGQENPGVSDLTNWYIAQCHEMGQAIYGNIPCIYTRYDNGELITAEQRIIYRNRPDLQHFFPDPFLTQPLEKSFLYWYSNRKFPDSAYKNRTLQSQPSESELVEFFDRFEKLQLNFDQLETQSKMLQNEINAMKTSKFWQLRLIWIDIKVKLKSLFRL